ncbi:hypothetical protein BV140_883 [Haemophilus influenzae]|nr:hypothetical protein BV083_825 [Haemophilus influenzae]AVI97647.1 hypothetical protein BV085_823 [Haemophilus influenzae]AVJ06666.1 hypothetical protein BV139_882 [Haemophilus influenzae]AVJ08499.1 hypothetical protein BV140_883 [Haemophilus influenzae]AVJ10225.1 hypothetical protein BVZ63_774 [Haemophilus influenzae]
MAAILGAERGKSQIKKCGKNLLRFFTALFTGRLTSWEVTYWIY